MRLHQQWRVPQLSNWDRLREWLGFHTHRCVHTQWDIDNPTWQGDPRAIDTCSCGHTKHMWYGETWD